jgi:TRAP-type C4-dicarboxylate transport system permease small subunit
MKASSPRMVRGIVLLGGAALLGAMAIDVVAVIGRHTGIPLLGSIELVQVLVAVAGAMALLIACLHDSHARVRLLLVRLAAAPRRRLLQIDDVLMAMFLLALAAGSGWILYELWGSHEETELWRLPYRPLRLLVVLTLLVAAGLMLRRLAGGERP